MSAIAISLGYLCRRPLPYLGYSSYGQDFIGNSTVLLILDSWGFKSVSRSDLSNLDRKYGLTTVNQKDIGLLSNLTV